MCGFFAHFRFVLTDVINVQQNMHMDMDTDFHADFRYWVPVPFVKCQVKSSSYSPHKYKIAPL